MATVVEQLETMIADATGAGNTDLATILTKAKTDVETHVASLWSRITAAVSADEQKVVAWLKAHV